MFSFYAGDQPVEELFGALMELTEASQALVEVRDGNDQDIGAMSDRYDDASEPGWSWPGCRGRGRGAGERCLIRRQ